MKVQYPLAPGTEIKLVRKDADPDEVAKQESYTVVKAYPHHHLLVHRNGRRMCITNAELLEYGLVKQDAVCDYVERHFPRFRG